MIVTVAITFLIVFLIKVKYGSSFLRFIQKIAFAKTVSGPGFIEFMEHSKKDRVLAWLKECTIKYGPVFKIWFGKDLNIFLTDPDDVRVVLSSNTILYKSYNYDFVKPWLRNGLLTSGGEYWHKKRKLLTPAFHFKILGTFKEPMEDNCDILIKKLELVADGKQAINIYSYVSLFALDVICETAMGIKPHAQTKEKSEYVLATKKICKLLHKQLFSLWQRIPFLYRFSAESKEMKRILDLLHGETRRVINLRRSMLDEMNLQNVDDIDKENSTEAVRQRFAFLDVLLLTQKQTNQLTDINIQEEVDTFMFEGHDTTSSAISFLLFLLSQHPDVQQKVYDEAMLFVGKETETMTYLEAVIKETLRLYPPLPMFSRRTNESMQIGKLTVPPETSITVLCYMVHRDPNIFPDPETFNPERFLTNEQIHPFAHIAFSAGPRNCIGQRFAMLELKCSVSKILRSFEVLPVEGFKPHPVPEITLKSDNGIQVRLKKRLQMNM